MGNCHNSGTKARWVALLLAIALLAASCGSDAPEPVAQDADDVDFELAKDAYQSSFDGSVSVEDLCEGDEGDNFPVVSMADSFLVIATLDDAAALEESIANGDFDGELLLTDGDGDRSIYRLEGAFDPEDRSREPFTIMPNEPQIVRNHAFTLHPLHRGHPTDDLDPPGTPAAYAAGALTTNGGVAVIDVDDPSARHGEHGPFVVSVIEATGVEAQLAVVPRSGSATGDQLLIEESDIVTALASIATWTNRPAVINMSFGTFGCTDHGPSGLTQAIVSTGIPVVASAGNDEHDQAVYPAALPDDFVVGVGSVSDDGNRSCFSNWGAWVDVWQPGEEVEGFGGAGTWSGTSFAAPKVAAEIAMGGSALDVGAPDFPANAGDPLYLYQSGHSSGAPVQSYCAAGSGYEPS